MERLGARIFRHGLVDSTNERAFAALAAGDARHGDVHVAQGQSAGRGRRGSRWESPPGEGLYASVVLAPPPPAPEPAGLTMLAGLGTWDALRSLGLAGVRLKWPNDLVVGGAKLAGILVEARHLDPERPACVVGIGVNVLQRTFPERLRAERTVTSLALEGCPATVDRVLDELCPNLTRRLEQLARPAELSGAYLEATGLRGRLVRAQIGSATFDGLLETLDLALGLGITTEGGLLCLPLAHVRALEIL